MRVTSIPSKATSSKFRNALWTSLQPLGQRHQLLMSNVPPDVSGTSSNSMMMLRQPTSASVNNLSISNNPLAYAMILTPSVSFFKYLMAFVAGGLFFSSVIAVVSATYAIGMDNVQRLMELLLYIVGKVWASFIAGLQAAKTTLLGEMVTLENGKTKRQWDYKKAWQVLKEQLLETKRQAAEGVQALREEATLYKAAVGPPGLIPLQYILDQLMPYSLASILEDSLRDSLKDFQATKAISKLKLSSFTAGTTAPVLEAARVYDVKDAIAFDYKIKWDSQVEATVQVVAVGGLARIPVSIRKIKFDGTIRIILTPLMKEAPGFGAALVSLPSTPNIGLDVRVAGGEVTKVPWLRSELMQGIQKGVNEQLAWPRRIVAPMLTPSQKPLLGPALLKKLESTDPLLEAEMERNKNQPLLNDVREKQQKQRSLRKRMKLLLRDDADALDDDADGKLQDDKTRELLETDTAKISAMDLTPMRHLSSVQRGVVVERLQEILASRREEKELEAERV
jgi:hypothetical protein